MKILNSKQIKKADSFTIINEPIISIDLMERAAKQCISWIVNRFNRDYHFQIFCGMRNNGGDGLAIARLLLERGYKVNCYVIKFTEKKSEDFKTNEIRFIETGLKLNFIQNEKDFPSFSLFKEKTIVIDSILGSGLTRHIEGITLKLVKKINESSFPIIAVDLPSGLFSENNTNNIRENIIKATYTLSFEIPKLALFLPENFINVGESFILPIGLNQNFINQQVTSFYLITLNTVKNKIKIRSKFSHKGNFGHALIIAGMKGKIGAGVLSALGCLKSGVGLLSICSPQCGYEILQTTVPEAMFEENKGINFLEGKFKQTKYNTIGLGPGIGQQKETSLFIKSVIDHSNTPLVLDADAINIISNNKSWLENVPENSIFTPHPKEFQRLVGFYDNDIDKLKKQLAFSQKYNCYIILKGAHASVSTPEGKVYFNTTGNPGMSTAGSGDVLTGLLVGLLAQKYTPKDTCILGVFLHGLAGDMAKKKIGEEALIASDIIAHISSAYLEIKKEI